MTWKRSIAPTEGWPAGTSIPFCHICLSLSLDHELYLASIIKRVPLWDFDDDTANSRISEDAYKWPPKNGIATSLRLALHLLQLPIHPPDGHPTRELVEMMGRLTVGWKHNENNIFGTSGCMLMGDSLAFVRDHSRIFKGNVKSGPSSHCFIPSKFSCG
ncbi:hypothetical protein N7456_001944 [Penicillium angulare]|uniref:Uncharacterized protein n=1 Tax=Penicillium angulare TaxID=116970 RepID=A0A9W9G7A5_9EURO|nr:hypothetical protein N7456_001944 [Penicillium angulare]